MNAGSAEHFKNQGQQGQDAKIYKRQNLMADSTPRRKKSRRNRHRYDTYSEPSQESGKLGSRKRIHAFRENQRRNILLDSTERRRPQKSYERFSKHSKERAWPNSPASKEMLKEGRDPRLATSVEQKSGKLSGIGSYPSSNKNGSFPAHSFSGKYSQN